MKMQTTAKLRFLRVAPRKVRLLADVVRGISVEDALTQLRYSKKHAARPLRKLLESAVANAKHNHDIDTKTLIVKTIFVDGGPVMKRWKPRAFGRAAPIRKRTSHVTVTLEGDAEEKAKDKKKEEKEEEVVADTAEEKKSVEKKKKEDKKPKASEKKPVKKAKAKAKAKAQVAPKKKDVK